MYNETTSASGVFRRRLKTHTKSRAGCRNCKVRRIKCDETKPDCRRCQAYGVRCSYASKTLLEPDLRTSSDRFVNIGALDLQRCSASKTMLGMINGAIDAYSQPDTEVFGAFRLDTADLNRLQRFQTRTVLSLGTSITGRVYQEQVIKLVHQYPYLMHTVMTITLMHDRYLTSPTSHPTLTETYHYAQAASLFRRQLSHSPPPSSHDALWATCAILGTISMFAIDATAPSQAWPLTTSSTDLDWLDILEGIHTVWALIKPTRPGSAFAGLTQDKSKESLLLASRTINQEQQQQQQTPQITPPPSFTSLCEITPSSTPDTNPYLSALQILTPLLSKPCTQETFLSYLGFTGHMHPQYKQLLRVRDPRALLILAYWYAKVCRGAPWFLRRRAVVECQAICLYLEREWGWCDGVMELVEWPRRECGLVGGEVEGERWPLTPVSMEEGSS